MRVEIDMFGNPRWYFSKDEWLDGIKAYMQKTDFRTFTLSVFDTIKEATVEIDNAKFEDFLNIIVSISQKEHTYPQWIGAVPLSESYVVGMEMTKGNIPVPCIGHCIDGKITFEPITDRR